jgi:16S rRNA (guanine966-N2)-methyltransferase
MSIRVIAGTLRRRTLKTPEGRGTRPTAGRVREALFSILGDLSDLAVLDLYAGSGALGIEALSRGASRALFVESDRAALACIRDNIAALGLGDRAKVLPARVERTSAARLAEGGAFDLVLCDPPWSEVDDAAAAIPPLILAFAEGVRVVLEHPARKEPSLSGFVCDDRRQWGDTGVSLFSRELS